MKKMLALVLALMLVLSCAHVLAEDESTVEQQTLQEILDANGIGHLHDDIVGTWYCQYIYYPYACYGGLLYDTQNSFSLEAVTLNADGTAIMHDRYYGDMHCNVVPFGRKEVTHSYTDGSSYTDSSLITLWLFDQASGEALLPLNLYDDTSGYMSTWCGIYSLNFEYEYSAEALVYFVKDFTPADEPAPIDPNATMSDMDGRWELQSLSAGGRKTCEYTYLGYYVNSGMVCEINTDSSTVIIPYNDFEWYSSQMNDNGDGTVTAVNYSGNEGDAVISLREDGTLFIQHADFDMIFTRLVVDPLTEYTDTDTIMAVQSALNSLGYDCGTPDGVSGKKTETAITNFQTDNGLTVTGTITEETLECLRDYGFIF